MCMTTKLKVLTFLRLNVQEPEPEVIKDKPSYPELELLNREEYSYFASILIALSGFVLYSDKAMVYLNWMFEVPDKFTASGLDFQTYIWLLSQTISPLLLVIGSFFRPFRISYVIPVYCYTLQLFFIFLDYQLIDDDYLQLYVVGSSLLFMGLLFTLQHLKKLYLKSEFNKV